jgi:hypothetical protein
MREATGDLAYNGIDRVDNKKGYTEENCVSCCGLCNRMKMKMGLSDFAKHIQKIHNFWAERFANNGTIAA